MTGRDDPLHRALAAADLCTEVASRSALAGGCIDQVERIALRDGVRVVAKTGSTADAARFRAEQAGLEALAATGTVVVPRPLACEQAASSVVLLMEYIKPGRATLRAWERFGADLAALHRADSGSRYGFAMDNYLGSTPQVNRWHDNWIEFNRACRFGAQIARAAEHGLLTPDENRELDDLMNRFERILPARPHPALLHGDLWSGNAIPAAGERVAVIDPACSIGDGWADIAMMQLFGGFPSSSLAAYEHAVNERLDADIERRILAYQLYHVLNHVNIFGRGYAGQMRSLVKALR